MPKQSGNKKRHQVVIENIKGGIFVLDEEMRRGGVELDQVVQLCPSYIKNCVRTVKTGNNS